MTAEKITRVQWVKLLRRLSVTLLFLVIAMVVLLLIGYQLLPIRKLHWSDLSVGTQQIGLSELSFQAGQGDQWWDVRLQQLDIGWRGWPLPFIKAQQMQLAPVLYVPDDATVPLVMPSAAPATAADFQLPRWPELTIPGWLPQQLGIRELLLQLPCQSSLRQLCQLQGSLLTSSDPNNHHLDLQLQGDGQQVQLQVDTKTQEQQFAQLNIQQLAIQLDLKALAEAGWIQGVPAGLLLQNIQLQLAGFWQADALELTLLQPLQVDFSYQGLTEQGGSLHIPAAQLQLQSGQLQCADARWQQCQLQLKASASVRQLQHPLVKVSDWQWQGQAQGPLTDLKLTGTLQNPPSLNMTYQAELSASALKLQWQLADLFLLAGNPLQITRLWPELLELQRGKINAEGQLQLQLPGVKLSKLQLKAQLSELYGIYDRTTFGGLTARLLLEGDPRSFTLQLPALTLQQLNHGFQAGPARVAGQYRADWTAPASGEVRLAQAQLGIFGGQLAVAQTQFNVQQPSVEFRVAVQQIQLAELLKQHPTGQMLGEGVLSGMIPLRYQQTKPGTSSQPASAQNTSAKPSATAQAIAQWQVLGGNLQAEAPGGRLQYQYQPLPGQKPSGMDLAWEALSDFRYQTLASTVELQPDGKVLMQVKLHGFNPKLQQGRPVHFNINLEEDLPALLTSLQLSGKISDLVRQRIQQKIQQKQAGKPAAIKPQ